MAKKENVRYAVKIRGTDLFLRSDSVLNPVFTYRPVYFTNRVAELLVASLHSADNKFIDKLVIVSDASTKETE